MLAKPLTRQHLGVVLRKEKEVYPTAEPRNHEEQGKHLNIVLQRGAAGASTKVLAGL